MEIDVVIENRNFQHCNSCVILPVNTLCCFNIQTETNAGGMKKSRFSTSISFYIENDTR